MEDEMAMCYMLSSSLYSSGSSKSKTPKRFTLTSKEKVSSSCKMGMIYNSTEVPLKQRISYNGRVVDLKKSRHPRSKLCSI